jgi:peroxiredoxin Q/BCP
VSRTLGLALIVLALAGPVRAADRPSALAVGDRAPDFTLLDQQGRPVRLSEVLRRRDIVVLAFYIRADTPG